MFILDARDIARLDNLIKTYAYMLDTYFDKHSVRREAVLNNDLFLRHFRARNVIVIFAAA